MVGLVNISPEAVLLAAGELDLLAERLTAAQALSAPATHVVPSGIDEVSLLAAQHFNKAAITHDQSVGQLVLELHHAAATLRSQLATHIGEDIVKAGVMNVQASTII